MIALFGFGGRDIPDRLETGEQANALRSREPATGVEPIDPLECGEFDRLEAAPGAAASDHLCLEGEGRARHRFERRPER
jgi:hypothetical protein